jgi:cytochrome c-type biogenesis protein CcmH/NrfF
LKRMMVVVAMLAVAVSSVAGQEPQPEGLYVGKGALPDAAQEARAVRLASELQCPVCQGQSINASPAPMAQQMKDLIRSQVAEGYSDEQVRQYFVSRYGEWVLLNPRAAGFNLLVYVLPVLALLGGLALVFTVVRRWSVPAADGAAVEE